MLLAGGVLLAGNFAAQAQFSAPGGLPPGFNRALFDVVAGGPAFSAQATIQLSSESNEPPKTVSCSIAYLDGKLRVECDSFDAGTNIPSAEAAKLKTMHTVTILRPEKNRMYLIYPGFRSCVETACYKNTGTDPEPSPVINKNPLGKDSLNDVSCEKCQWNIAELNGEHYDLTVWTSNDLNDFPVQIRLGPPTTFVTFQNVQFEPPDANLFEPPAGYVRYQGIQENIVRETEKAQNPSQNTNSP